MLERFFRYLFFVSKAVSALFTFVMLGTIVFAILALMIDRTGSIDVPDFSDVQTSYEAPTSRTDYSDLDEKRSVEKRFGDDISKLVKKYGWTEQSYDQTVLLMARMDQRHRKAYLKGLRKTLARAEDWAEDSKNPKFDVIDAANRYNDLFIQGIAEWEEAKAETEGRRLIWLGTLVGAIVCLIGFLIVPLLIQIEENTRSYRDVQR